MFSSSFRECFSVAKTAASLQRSFTTGTALAIKSPGPREFTPSNVKRPPGRFGWSVRARWVKPTLQLINRRKEMVTVDNVLRFGRDKIPRRSEFNDWNYNSELFAFQARIGEKFDEAKLREAFITQDYLTAEQLRRKNLGVDLIQSEGDEASSLWSTSNQSLAENGSQIVQGTLKSYLHLVQPNLPDDAVAAVVQHLTSEEMMAHVSFHIGTKDLVLSEEYPPSVHNMATTFLALVAALNESSGAERSIRLVLDLVAPQLHGLDVTDVWDLQNPMGYLVKVLERAKMGEPVSRLLWTSGKETILACYHVGIYSNKELIGQAPGETADIAEDMAARDALRRLLRFDDASRPVALGRAVDQIVPLVIEDNAKFKSLS